MNGRSYQRKNYFIKKEFQLKFMLKFCLLLLVGALISSGLLILFSQDTLTSSYQESKLVIQQTGEAILPSLILTNLFTLALISLAAVVVTLFVSHKIAGPLFRLERELQAVSEGDLTRRIVLRQKDQVTPMAECINTMLGNLQHKVTEIQKDVEQLQQIAAAQNVPHDVVESLNSLHKKISSSFKI